MVFERLKDEDFAYLTTTGRTSGRAHRIEIWFAIDGGRMYLLSGGGDDADWVKNIRKNGTVRVQVGSRSVEAIARIARASSSTPSTWAGGPGKKLSSWARGATPLAIDLPD